jgi:DUF1009 family protein
MEKRLGVIAGSGESPAFIQNRARELGYLCVTAAIQGEAEPALQPAGGILSWFQVANVASIIRFFKSHGIQRAVFAGKIGPRHIYPVKSKGTALAKMLEKGRDRGSETVIRMAMDYFARRGITFMSPEPFLKPLMCPEGPLTKKRPTASAAADIAWGWERARRLADTDIGQCIIVKAKAVVAVEGLEGTDAAILRGGELAGPGCVAIKVARSHQDPRVDLPAVGLDTVKSLVKAGGIALCFEAQRMPFFQKEAAVALAERHGLSISTHS